MRIEWNSHDGKGQEDRENIVNLMAKQSVSLKYQVWIDARKKFRLSHAQIQMARELGMNPKKFGSLNNADQEPWKLPLAEFIEELYHKRFGKTGPDNVRAIEEVARAEKKKRAERSERKLSEREQGGKKI